MASPCPCVTSLPPYLNLPPNTGYQFHIRNAHRALDTLTPIRNTLPFPSTITTFISPSPPHSLKHPFSPSPTPLLASSLTKIPPHFSMFSPSRLTFFLPSPHYHTHPYPSWSSLDCQTYQTVLHLHKRETPQNRHYWEINIPHFRKTCKTKHLTFSISVPAL